MITLAPLSRAELARVQHLILPPSQAPFVGTIEEMTADHDALQDFHIGISDETVVAFFKIDRAFDRRIPWLPQDAHGLRGLLVGGQYQRQGHGRALLARLSDYLRRGYPGLGEVFLSVDAGNAVARRAYANASWSAMRPRHQGRSGEEVVMRLPLYTAS